VGVYKINKKKTHYVQNLTALALAIPEMWMWPSIFTTSAMAEGPRNAFVSIEKPCNRSMTLTYT